MPRFSLSSRLALGTVSAALVLSSCSTPSAEPPTPLGSSSTSSSSEQVTVSPDPIPAPTTDDPESVDPATDAPVPTPAPSTVIDVVITNTIWVPETSTIDVGAYAAVPADEGTCTLRLTKGDESFSATSQSVPDIQTTSCGDLNVAQPGLSSGTWQVQVEYSSTAYSGTSDQSAVVIP